MFLYRFTCVANIALDFIANRNVRGVCGDLLIFPFEIYCSRNQQLNITFVVVTLCFFYAYSSVFFY